MKRIFSIILALFGLLLLFCAITYADIKIKERNDRIKRYNYCVERNKELQFRIGSQGWTDERIAGCRNNGGCFEPCGGGCGGELGYLPTTNLIFDRSHIMCAAVCVPMCVEKP